jgi:hypothetical protein
MKCNEKSNKDAARRAFLLTPKGYVPIGCKADILEGYLRAFLAA